MMVMVLLNLVHLFFLIYFHCPRRMRTDSSPLAFVVCSLWEIPVVDQKEGGERSKYLFFWHINLQGWLGLVVSLFGRFMDFSRQFPLCDSPSGP